MGVCAAASPGLAQAARKAVRYRGTTVRVPATWPVYDLTAHPGLCVRFDRSAVYLGRPATRQNCPAGAAGRSRAILLEPRGAGAIVVRQAAQTLGTEMAPRPRAAGGAVPRTAGASFTGLGFDACAAPSASVMNHWLTSPYRAIGVYIGGANMACAQPNLTAPWVSTETAAGWHFILTYVGLQAPGNSCGCASINPAQAAAQGRAAAGDAVSHAGALGIGPGNPIYFDMEAYSRTSANTRTVLAFLSAWTKRLHADGYQAGVYSSSGSGVSDLAASYGGSYPEPDDIWFAEWNGSQSTGSAYIPAADWPDHQRLHQYAGDHNETYGGATLNIDGDAIDGASATAGHASLIPDGTFIKLTSTGQFFRIAGDAPMFVSNWATVAGPQPSTRVGAQEFAALSPEPRDGTFLATQTGALYTVAGGAPFAVSQPTLFPGAQPVQIDPWDLQNLGSPLAHLSTAPADATIVEGLPSRTYWIFAGGRRRRTTASPAVAVDDQGLAQFPLQPCLVPRLAGLSLAGARASLAQTNCQLGRVVRVRDPQPGHLLHVIRQFPGAGAHRHAGTEVAVRLG